MRENSHVRCGVCGCDDFKDYLSLVIFLRGLIKKVMINPITTMINAAVKAMLVF